MKRLLVLLALAAAVAVAGCSRPVSGSKPAAPVELNVSAASSLRSVLETLAPAFEKSERVKLVFNFGSSGQLQKQIESGAPVDAFLSASPSQVASLVAENLVSDEETSTFAGNHLVVLVPSDNPKGIAGPETLSRADKLATGDPITAPHGAKAKEWLSRIGLWDTLQGRFVFAENAAQTLDYVSRGEVDAAIGFESETRGREDVKVAYIVPDGAIKPIRYVAAPIGASTHAEKAKRFVAYLKSPAAQAAFVAAGFLPAPAK